MTMLTHTLDPFTPASHSSERRNSAGAGAANAHLATIKRFYVCALLALLAGGTATGIVAPKTASYF